MLGHCGDVYLWGGGSEGQLGMGANVSELLKPTVLQVRLGRVRVFGFMIIAVVRY